MGKEEDYLTNVVAHDVLIRFTVYMRRRCIALKTKNYQSINQSIIYLLITHQVKFIKHLHLKAELMHIYKNYV